MHTRSHKGISSERTESSKHEGKSLSPPAFSLQASAADAGQPNLNGTLGIEPATDGSFFLGTLDDVINGQNNEIQVGGHQEQNPEVVPQAPPVLSHRTLEHAPDGTSDDRLRIGVGEVVVFNFPTEGDWTATAGSPANQNAGNSFTWTAPKRGGNATITISSGEQTASVTMEVVEPQSNTPKKIDEIAYPPGTMGAGMHMHFDYSPMSVSFSRVEAGEVSGPATNITGYFSTFDPADLWHDSGDGFFGIDVQNRLIATDTAAGSGLSGPYSDGGLHWVIPNRFRVSGEGGDGKIFGNVTQTFQIQADGTFTVTKGNESVTRTP